MKTFIDGDFFESISDYSYGDFYTTRTNPNSDHIEELYLKLGRTPILFINTERIEYLLLEAGKFGKDVIIITHNSDITLDTNIIDKIPENVIRVWSQNYNGIKNDKIKPLPIGLERKRWFPEQNKQIIIGEYSELDNIDKEYNVYMNFNIKTNSERKTWHDTLKDKDFVVTEMKGNGGGFLNYINKMIKSKFVLSPPGNGIDCHRNWESLYIGTIPIIKRSNFSSDIFSGLPVLLIDDIEEIDTVKLNDFYRKNDFKNPITYEKLTCDYWGKIIKDDVKIRTGK